MATDLSPAMLALAREEAARLGLRNVEFREMDAEEPDLIAGSFDAALCRWTLMFLPRLEIALARLRALLVPGGRFAAAVWGPPEREIFIEERQATFANIRILLGETTPSDRTTIWQAIAQAVVEYQDAEGGLRVPNETLCVVGKA